ncbi:AAA family ATPase [Candidatus Nomurabacteria bacterium]|nr:AAA family ATPase [Candidatus Nomurabacteria bacterium]
MRLKSLELSGFKSFAKKSILEFDTPISSIVGPNGSGKSNIAESFRFVLGEQSIKSLRGKRGEDLIFGGTQAMTRQNRASVKVFFDNDDRRLPLDFDEVSIERIVHRDGVNEYLINNSQVRLKDVSELLASANIGSTGHHIISQGETDRILNTSPKERRSMLEDALGLKVFQYKKVESEKKLLKTEENVKQVQSLRKEIAPHIKFLKKQVEKIEKSQELREKLKVFYKEYLKKEDLYIKFKKEDLRDKLKQPMIDLGQVDAELNDLKKQFEGKGHNDSNQLENQLSKVNNELSELIRSVGQIEGEINSLVRIKNQTENKPKNQETVLLSDVQELQGTIDNLIKQSEMETELSVLRQIFSKIKSSFETFIGKKPQNISDQTVDFDKQIDDLENEQEKIEVQIDELKEVKVELEKALENESKKSQGSEKLIYELMTKKNHLETEINTLKSEQDIILRDEAELKREFTEAAILVGRDVIELDDFEINEASLLNEPRSEQREKRRELEKMKIRVEEFGAGSGDEILKEYKDVSERDEFLIKEIEDLEKSSASLKVLIAELEEQINNKFKEGIDKINREFQKLFEIMFGGGEAALKLVKPVVRKKKDTDLDLSDDIEEEEETEEGIDIHVSLPRKKIKGLMMLSGGERALTSIALLFAMSAVNPPPFIILDETDAALDEANSKKYADMIESLSKHSQLIVITHNRETMSRAGILYGVTMQQGISQLLSIKFAEGVQYAK